MKDPLELENRRRIHQEVTLNPGLHYRELQRRLGMVPGLLDYHLAYLEERELIVSRREDNYTRYYPSNRIRESQKAALNVLRQDIPRAVVIYLLMNPGATHKDILATLDVTGATLSYHMKKLVKAGVVEAVKEGRTTRNRVLDEDGVAELLITYKKSFVDNLVDSFAAFWAGRTSKEQR